MCCNLQDKSIAFTYERVDVFYLASFNNLMDAQIVDERYQYVLFTVKILIWNFFRYFTFI